MRLAFFFGPVFALFPFIASCSTTNGATPLGGSDDASVAPTGPSGLPCNVEKVFVEHCQQCHSAAPKFGAPMPLVTHADLIAAAKSDPTKSVYDLVSARIKDDAKPMPQPPNARLDASQVSAVDAWVAAGAPESSAGCTTTTTPSADGGTTPPSVTPGTPGPLSCTPNLAIIPAGAWTMPKTTKDEYVCFGVDVTVPTKKQVIAFAPRIVNSTIVHHVLLYQTPLAVDPAHTPCGAGGGSGWRMMYAWAPGGPNMTLPPEAGFPLEGTTHYAVQVHYSNIGGLDGQTDTSGFDACTTDELRANDADVLAFGTVNINIPARGTLDRTCDFKVPAAVGTVNLVAAFPHMHKLGTAIETTQLPADGSAPVSLGRQAQWDFNNQLWFGIGTTAKPGDTIRTRCAWANPTDTAVRFGEKTEDEMCYSFTMYYPKISVGAWNWQAPAFASSCRNTQ